MSQRVLLLASILALTLCAQQVSRKPSPFPEKNREKESAAPATGKSDSPPPRSGSSASAHARTASVADDSGTGSTTSGGTGKACFFSSSSDGRLTASGGRLNAKEMVAGHATYALGSRVKVTNLANGRTVEVRIVDRFPDSRRIINVSEAAARQLGFFEAGTADVKLDLLRQGTAPREP